MANEDPLRVWQEQPVEGGAAARDPAQGREVREQDTESQPARIHRAAVVLAAFTFYFFWFQTCWFAWARC